MEKNITEIIQAISENGDTVYGIDRGQEDSGPFRFGPDILIEMLNNGEFDDAHIVELDKNLQKEVFKNFGIKQFIDGTDWIQIENYGQGGYVETMWVWVY